MYNEITLILQIVMTVMFFALMAIATVTEIPRRREKKNWEKKYN